MLGPSMDSVIERMNRRGISTSSIQVSSLKLYTNLREVSQSQIIASASQFYVDLSCLNVREGSLLIQSECGWARVGAAADESVSTQHSVTSWCGPGGRASQALQTSIICQLTHYSVRGNKSQPSPAQPSPAVAAVLVRRMLLCNLQ